MNSTSNVTVPHQNAAGSSCDYSKSSAAMKKSSKNNVQRKNHLLGTNMGLEGIRRYLEQESPIELQLDGEILNVPHNGESPELSDVIATIEADQIEAQIADPTYNVDAGTMSRAYVEIIEQPASKGLRFRYECEGRSAGSIPGVTSKPENKTYPTIRIHGVVGQAIIIVSCVTKDSLCVHPHNLVGKSCDKGVYTYKVDCKTSPYDHELKNIGIQCVKRVNIAQAIGLRQQCGVDPFQMGFRHQNDPLKIDLNCVRLAIQVIVKDAQGRDISLRPVHSDVICDKKAASDLVITRYSHCSGPASGDTCVIVLCDKLIQAGRDDIVVAFREKHDAAGAGWWVEVTPTLVHKQFALVFKTPPYRNPALQRPHTVEFQLLRRSDRDFSAPVDFEYTPTTEDYYMANKRRKKQLPSQQSIESYPQSEHGKAVAGAIAAAMQQDQKIKLEPRDTHQVSSPPHAMFTYTPQPESQWGAEQGTGQLQAFGQSLPYTFSMGAGPSRARQLSPLPPAYAAPSPAGYPAASPAGYLSPSTAGYPSPSPAGYLSPSPAGYPSPSPTLGYSPAQPSPITHPYNVLEQSLSPDPRGYAMHTQQQTIQSTAPAPAPYPPAAPALPMDQQSLTDLLREAGPPGACDAFNPAEIFGLLADSDNLSNEFNRLSTEDKN